MNNQGDLDRIACADALRTLAHWAVSVELADMPQRVVQKASRILADDLSALIGARDEAEVARYHRRVLSRQRPAEATIWRGGRARTDTVSAAVANAVAGDWLELDEGYRLVGCHAGLYTIPALLAVAETSDLSFSEMLRALVLGYEIVTRVAMSWRVGQPTMQAHGRYGAIGAAAATALALRLEGKQMVDALTAAATLIGPSPRTHLVEGALVRNVWPAAAAWSGMTAVEWVLCGIGGAPAGLYDVYTGVLGAVPQPEQLTLALGGKWAVLDGYSKVYACCQYVHSAVEAAIELRDRLPAENLAAAIDAITVDTHQLAMPLTNARPHTTLAAKFSMPHAIATALVTGNAGASAFTAATLGDAAIAALRDRVKMHPYTPQLPPPNDRPARVTVRMRDGRSFVGECLSARGGSDRPLPEDAWVEKMQELAAPVYPNILSVFEELVGAEPRRLAQSWRSIADEICPASTPTHSSFSIPTEVSA